MSLPSLKRFTLQLVSRRPPPPLRRETAKAIQHAGRRQEEDDDAGGLVGGPHFTQYIYIYMYGSESKLGGCVSTGSRQGYEGHQGYLGKVVGRQRGYLVSFGCCLSVRQKVDVHVVTPTTA